MAWKWPSAAKTGAGEEWTGFIDQGVTLEGTLTVKGTFRVDGNVKGNIISEQTVVLGEGAKVEGQIEGNRVVISGRFDFCEGTGRDSSPGSSDGRSSCPMHGD
jgi:cytoskeletal protein CcmA (bactofilin family)